MSMVEKMISHQSIPCVRARIFIPTTHSCHNKNKICKHPNRGFSKKCAGHQRRSAQEINGHKVCLIKTPWSINKQNMTIVEGTVAAANFKMTNRFQFRWFNFALKITQIDASAPKDCDMSDSLLNSQIARSCEKKVRNRWPQYVREYICRWKMCAREMCKLKIMHSESCTAFAKIKNGTHTNEPIVSTTDQTDCSWSRVM